MANLTDDDLLRKMQHEHDVAEGLIPPVTTLYLLHPGLGAVEPWPHETVREALEKAEHGLRSDEHVLTALIFEAMPLRWRTPSGSDEHIETRYRLAAQLWRRRDGHVDTRVYGVSECPWGSTA
jgi:hypothetical protein